MTTLFRRPGPTGPRRIRRFTNTPAPRIEPRADIEGPTAPPGPGVSPDGPDVPEVVAGQVITSAWGSDVADDLAELHADIAAVAAIANAGVPTVRTISTTAPLSGGGDLSVNRTLGVSTFGASVSGVVPASGGGSVNYLRADGTWAAPSGGGTPVTDGDKGDIIVSGSGTTWMLDAGVAAPFRRPVQNVNLATLVVSLTDENTMIAGGWPTDMTCALPSNATVPFPIGAEIDFLNLSPGGTIIFSAGAGATCNSTPGLKLRARYSACTAKKVAINGWVVIGDMSA